MKIRNISEEVPPEVLEAIQQMAEALGEKGIELNVDNGPTEEPDMMDVCRAIENVIDQNDGDDDPRIALLGSTLNAFVQVFMPSMTESMIRLEAFEEATKKMMTEEMAKRMAWIEEHREELKYPDLLIEFFKGEEQVVPAMQQLILGCRGVLIYWKHHPLTV